jgi:hypothetical protein
MKLNLNFPLFDLDGIECKDQDGTILNVVEMFNDL